MIFFLILNLLDTYDDSDDPRNCYLYGLIYR